MEVLDGHDLMTEIDTRGSMPLDEAAHYVAQACHAMMEAHALGIVHRDLKPPNLFLANEAGGRKVKVLDFGISKITSSYDGTVTSTQMSFGSPLYMSPGKSGPPRASAVACGRSASSCTSASSEPRSWPGTRRPRRRDLDKSRTRPSQARRASPSFDVVIAGALQRTPETLPVRGISARDRRVLAAWGLRARRHRRAA
jgi:serine/threonine protein kinase